MHPAAIYSTIATFFFNFKHQTVIFGRCEKEGCWGVQLGSNDR